MKVRIEGQPLNSVLGIKSRFVGNGGDECSVEELALQYYAAEAGGSWTGQLNRLRGPLEVPLSNVLSCFSKYVVICFLPHFLKCWDCGSTAGFPHLADHPLASYTAALHNLCI